MDKNKKIGLVSLIMMIFSSIFGFANIPVAFLQMGYASIIWYIFAAIFFFLPVAMMLAEYGATFKEEEGGIPTLWVKSGPSLGLLSGYPVGLSGCSVFLLRSTFPFRLCSLVKT